MPPALFPVTKDNAFLISTKEGTSAKSSRIIEGGKESTKSRENTLAVFKTESKCCYHLLWSGAQVTT